jgi:hypothetical protein
MDANDTLDTFFKILTVGSGDYQQVDDMMALFCDDDHGKKIPFVGLTDYGPSFQYKDDIRQLWTQLFLTFPDDFSLTEVPPRGYSNAGPNTILVQTRLGGTHKADWFEPYTNNHYSPPLSGLAVTKKSMNLPACAAFTFDGAYKITKIAIYFDRYRMAKTLGANLP